MNIVFYKVSVFSQEWVRNHFIQNISFQFCLKYQSQIFLLQYWKVKSTWSCIWFLVSVSSFPWTQTFIISARVRTRKYRQLSFAVSYYHLTNRSFSEIIHEKKITGSCLYIFLFVCKCCRVQKSRRRSMIPVRGIQHEGQFLQKRCMVFKGCLPTVEF